MTNETVFQYTYRAPANQEVLNIRRKYLPREETHLEELKRLDNLVQNAGTIESLSLGLGSCLLFVLGMCFAMKVIGNAMWLGILLGIIGSLGMILAYPINRRCHNDARKEYGPRILELSEKVLKG